MATIDERVDDLSGRVQKLEDKIKIIADDDYKLKSVTDILQSKAVKRSISLKSFDYWKDRICLPWNGSPDSYNQKGN